MQLIRKLLKMKTNAFHIKNSSSKRTLEMLQSLLFLFGAPVYNFRLYNFKHT